MCWPKTWMRGPRSTFWPEIPSLVDARVYVWQPKSEKWRLLTIAEQKAMYELRRGVDYP